MQPGGSDRLKETGNDYPGFIIGAIQKITPNFNKSTTLRLSFSHFFTKILSGFFVSIN
jgi:hypothetical protein